MYRSPGSFTNNHNIKTHCNNQQFVDLPYLMYVGERDRHSKEEGFIEKQYRLGGNDRENNIQTSTIYKLKSLQTQQDKPLPSQEPPIYPFTIRHSPIPTPVVQKGSKSLLTLKKHLLTPARPLRHSTSLPISHRIDPPSQTLGLQNLWSVFSKLLSQTYADRQLMYLRQVSTNPITYAHLPSQIFFIDESINRYQFVQLCGGNYGLVETAIKDNKMRGKIGQGRYQIVVGTVGEFESRKWVALGLVEIENKQRA